MRILNTQTERLPLAFHDSIHMIAVLTCGSCGEGPIGDSAVYIGAAHLWDYDLSPALYSDSKERAAEWIAHNGRKLTYRESLHYFPSLREAEYRL